MSTHEDDHSSKRHYNHFPLDSSSYKILSEIGLGVSAIVYKAICISTNATVAIKAIDLDRSKADDIDTLRRETKTMSLLTHPNILNAHCSFIVDNKLWVVMPFMSCGSLHSIMSSNYHNGLTEPCIAIILKETLKALCYLHDQGHVHRDIKAGNILIDANGAVKLADFGVSASIYESGSSSFATSSLTDVAGTPYWMAPEVIHSHNGYSFKADIWSFGITALELAHGRPPLSNLPPSTSLLMKITKRFRFSDYEKHCDPSKRSSSSGSTSTSHDHKKFSKSFKDMVGSCLDQDPSRRPTADKLLKHSFFKNCKCVDYLVRNVLQGLPSVEERFKLDKFSRSLLMKESGKDCGNEEEENMTEGVSKQRRISGWNFNEDGFELDPVFRSGVSFTTATRRNAEDEEFVVKNARFGGESIIPGTHIVDWNQTESEAEEDPLLLSSQPQAPEVSQELDSAEERESHQMEAEETTRGVSSSGAGREFMLGTLEVLRRSLEDEMLRVNNLISLLGGVVGESREEQLVETVERLSSELENERKRRSELEMELWRHTASGSRY